MYDDMRKGAVYKTAQIPTTVFHEKFEEIAKSGEPTIYIAFRQVFLELIKLLL